MRLLGMSGDTLRCFIKIGRGSWMSNIVRFNEWLINIEEIEHTSIEPVLGEQEQARLSLVLKTGKILNLVCYNQDDAMEQLDLLTANLKAPHLCRYEWDHYFVKRVAQMVSAQRELAFEVRKLMKSYSKTKDKKDE